MSIAISLNPRLYGKWRKWLKKHGFTSLARFFTRLESWRYACSRMSKSGYAKMEDFYVHISGSGLQIFCTAYHQGIDINSQGLYIFYRHTIRSFNFRLSDWWEILLFAFVSKG